MVALRIDDVSPGSVRIQTEVVVAGVATGPVVVLDEALSFWGGFESATGEIIDEHHPQVGVCLSAAVVVVRSGRGSSSASSVIAEAARLGTGPAALIMREPDEIIATGAIVADELYGRPLPVLIVDGPGFAQAAAARYAAIGADGVIELSLDP